MEDLETSYNPYHGAGVAIGLGVGAAIIGAAKAAVYVHRSITNKFGSKQISKEAIELQRLHQVVAEKDQLIALQDEQIAYQEAQLLRFEMQVLGITPLVQDRLRTENYNKRLIFFSRKRSHTVVRETRKRKAGDESDIYEEDLKRSKIHFEIDSFDTDMSNKFCLSYIDMVPSEVQISVPEITPQAVHCMELVPWTPKPYAYDDTRTMEKFTMEFLFPIDHLNMIGQGGQSLAPEVVPETNPCDTFDEQTCRALVLWRPRPNDLDSWVMTYGLKISPVVKKFVDFAPRGGEAYMTKYIPMLDGMAPVNLSKALVPWRPRPSVAVTQIFGIIRDAVKMFKARRVFEVEMYTANVFMDMYVAPRAIGPQTHIPLLDFKSFGTSVDGSIPLRPSPQEAETQIKKFTYSKFALRDVGSISDVDKAPADVSTALVPWRPRPHSAAAQIITSEFTNTDDSISPDCMQVANRIHYKFTFKVLKQERNETTSYERDDDEDELEEVKTINTYTVFCVQWDYIVNDEIIRTRFFEIHTTIEGQCCTYFRFEETHTFTESDYYVKGQLTKYFIWDNDDIHEEEYRLHQLYEEDEQSYPNRKYLPPPPPPPPCASPAPADVWCPSSWWIQPEIEDECPSDTEEESWCPSSWWIQQETDYEVPRDTEEDGWTHTDDTISKYDPKFMQVANRVHYKVTFEILKQEREETTTYERDDDENVWKEVKTIITYFLLKTQWDYMVNDEIIRTRILKTHTILHAQCCTDYRFEETHTFTESNYFVKGQLTKFFLWGADDIDREDYILYTTLYEEDAQSYPNRKYLPPPPPPPPPSASPPPADVWCPSSWWIQPEIDYESSCDTEEDTWCPSSAWMQPERSHEFPCDTEEDIWCDPAGGVCSTPDQGGKWWETPGEQWN